MNLKIISVLNKIENLGQPLEQSWNVYTGSIKIGKPSPFVIEKSTLQQLIDEDTRSREIVERILLRKQNKWETHPVNLIKIASSHKINWPWSFTNDETEAEKVFQRTYPAIYKHLKRYKERLKTKHHQDKGKFWWELKPMNFLPTLCQPKIVYSSVPGVGRPMQAAYDAVGLPTQAYLHSIIPADLHLLAILNSRLLSWYFKSRFNQAENKLSLKLRKGKMSTVPIAKMNIDQKTGLSLLVHRILSKPDSADVPSIEQEINQLVYKLYELTPAEIKLIQKETNK